jgi:hypothetical protein
MLIGENIHVSMLYKALRYPTLFRDVRKNAPLSLHVRSRIYHTPITAETHARGQNMPQSLRLHGIFALMAAVDPIYTLSRIHGESNAVYIYGPAGASIGSIGSIQ